ncbi:Arm DNA-binding domain-containing protein [Myroides odoratus]|uniref:Arm DNA-binding domain-containing protein n=1 Tax=Myroides odoratus TaxID=256 RepID=UPI00333E9E1B
MLNILFLLQKNRTNQKGTCPIRCRLTYLKTRKEFSTGLFINPKYWQNSKQRAHPPNEENNFINTQLSLIKNHINQAFFISYTTKKPIVPIGFCYFHNFE